MAAARPSSEATPEQERWAELRARFEELIELGPAARAARLEAIGAADPEARRELEALFAADAAADRRLARVEDVFGIGDGEPADVPADVLALVGRTVAHFRITEPLAAGGMGVVYRAEDTQLERAVALKFPLPEQRLDWRARERFLREARAVGALDHPNLCSIYEAGETGEGHLYLAMALYEGETLRARIAREGALPIGDAIAIGGQIARGLGAAHRASIVHRDLKPANIALLPDGGLKILDFGLARFTDVSRTVTGATIGTVSYMAPEQVRGQTLDARADLWGLGVVLYEMVAGRRPFEGEHEIAIAHAIVHAEPARLSALRPEVPAALERLVHRLLTRNPERRPDSAEAVEIELTAIAQHAVRAPRPGAAHALTAFARRRRRPLLAAALLVLVLGFTAWLFGRRAGATAERPLLLGVLSFETADTASAHLGLGLSDAIAVQLARVRALIVPSELSTWEYRDTEKDWRQIARDLQAGALLRGRVTQNRDSVQLVLELLDAGRGRRAWRERFAAPFNELPALQRNAGQAVARALRVQLSDDERTSLARLPTRNAEAYDAYLRGRAALLRGRPTDVRRLSEENLRHAQSLLARARELDPTFAEARARLAMSHLYSAEKYDRSAARREQARLEAEAALRSVPGLGEAHDALGRYWYLAEQPERAAAELELARRGLPNSGDINISLGHAYRGLGRWEEAAAAFDRGMRFEPRYGGAFYSAGMTLNRMRRYRDAVHAWDRLIALGSTDPDRFFSHLIRGFVFTRIEGRPDTLEAELQRIAPEWDQNGMATWARMLVRHMRRDWTGVLAVLDSARQPLSRDGLIFRPHQLIRAQAWQRIGNVDSARTYYTTARALLEDSVAAYPRDASMRIALGLAYAGLGHRAQALVEARRATELVPFREDNPTATAFMGGAIEVYMAAGDLDAALQLIEFMLTINAGRELSVPLLRSDPTFDPLRADPRFEQILDRFATHATR